MARQLKLKKVFSLRANGGVSQSLQAYVLRTQEPAVFNGEPARERRQKENASRTHRNYEVQVTHVYQGTANRIVPTCHRACASKHHSRGGKSRSSRVTRMLRQRIVKSA